MKRTRKGVLAAVIFAVTSMMLASPASALSYYPDTVYYQPQVPNTMSAGEAMQVVGVRSTPVNATSVCATIQADGNGTIQVQFRNEPTGKSLTVHENNQWYDLSHCSSDPSVLAAARSGYAVLVIRVTSGTVTVNCVDLFYNVGRWSGFPRCAI